MAPGYLRATAEWEPQQGKVFDLPGLVDSRAGRRPCPTSGQGDLPAGGLRVLPVEQRGVADGADAHAAALVSDLRAEHRALGALRPEKPQLHQLVLNEKEPDYTVDEQMNRIFHFKDKASVICYQF